MSMTARSESAEHALPVARAPMQTAAAVGTGSATGPKHAVPTAQKIVGPVDPVELVSRYRSYALVGDCASAVLAAVIAHIVRFGQSAPQLYVTLTLMMPLLWIGMLALQQPANFGD